MFLYTLGARKEINQYVSGFLALSFCSFFSSFHVASSLFHTFLNLFLSAIACAFVCIKCRDYCLWQLLYIGYAGLEIFLYEPPPCFVVSRMVVSKYTLCNLADYTVIYIYIYIYIESIQTCIILSHHFCNQNGVH